MFVCFFCLFVCNGADCCLCFDGLSFIRLFSFLACSEKLSNMSGYFFSPSFPGFYLDDSFCTWQIAVPDRNIIRLTFLEFRLRDHPTCENCYLEIFDGDDETAPAIGKVCGYSYPPVFVSSSSYLTVVLRCHGKPPIARFKAFYQSVAGKHFFFSESVPTTFLSQ